MKKLLLAGLFLLAVPFATMAEMADVDTSGQEETPSCIELKNNMRYRMRDANTNGEVSILQDFLNGEGFLKTAPTGFFGLSTLKAVKNFQSSIKLSPTGYVGKLTRAQIKEMTCEGVGEATTTTTIPPITTVASCTTPWGSSVANGSSVTASQFSTVSYDQTCVAETRACSNGVLSGTYKYATCATQTVSTTPSITILSPNGGEQIQEGATQTIIKWSTKNFSGLNVSIDLVDSTGYVTNIASNISNTGYYYWNTAAGVKGGYLGGYSYKIRISSNDKGPSAVDDSDSYFSIATATTETITTAVPTVEFIGTPTLSLQYDSAGKESMLVGKTTVKVTAAGTPIAFGGSVPVLLSTNGRQAYTNSTKVSVASSVGVSTVG